MLKRVRAAWRVLRGEWTANAPAPLVYELTNTAEHFDKVTVVRMP
jgi:hypothetical protein